ncbi:MAG: cytochrome c biogenesis protein CcdA [Pseudomonadota bacterium]
MKKFINISVLLTIMVLLWPSSPWAATVRVEDIHSRDEYPVGGTYPILLRLRISATWYIHGTKGKGSGLIPTVLSLHGSHGVKVEEITFPDPERKKFSYTTTPVEVYSGDILVKATLVVDEIASTGKHEINGTLSYQACSANVCLAPEKIPIRFSVVLVPRGKPTMTINQELFLSIPEERGAEGGFLGGRAKTGFLLTLLSIFLGGLALNLTPCIYPLIPITVSYFSGRSHKILGHKVLHGIFYISGLALTNSILGVSAALSGGMLGTALQNPLALILVAGIMFVLSLSFFGFWEIRIPAVLGRVASRNYGGYPGTFFMGLTLGIVAAPCLGPFILGLLTYVGQKGDPFLGFLYFFVLSIGLGLPLSILGVFSGAIERLPLSGDWMVWVRKFMGWVLVGMAAYIISPLIQYPWGNPALLAGVAVAGGIHLGWIERTGEGFLRFSRFKRISGIILIGAGLVYLLFSLPAREGIVWTPYNEMLISEAASKDRPVILDFYADWCGPCVAMEKEVFRDPEVVRLSRNFAPVRVDLTRRLPFQDEILKRYGVRGVPTVIFMNREGVEERALRVESLVGRSEFLGKMKRLLEGTERKGDIHGLKE